MERVSRYLIPVDGSSASSLVAAHGGWLVTTCEGCFLCRDDDVLALDLDATPADGSRTPLAVAVGPGGEVFIASHNRVYSLDAEGGASELFQFDVGEVRVPSYFAYDGTEFTLVTRPLPPPPNQRTVLYRLDESGTTTGELELLGNESRSCPGVRLGSAHLIDTGQGIAKVVGAEQERLTGGAPFASLGDVVGVTTGGWDDKAFRPLSFVERRRGESTPERVEVSGDYAPNFIALGDEWTSWSIGNKLFVRTDGQETKLRTGGRVTGLASNGTKLAVGVLGANKPALLVFA